MTRPALFDCCVHCGCEACDCGDHPPRPGHSTPCDFGCNGDITVVQDHGVTVAQLDAYSDALQQRDLARTVAVKLEGELEQARAAVRELRALSGHGLPVPDVTSPASQPWDTQCRACGKPWPCPTEVLFRRAAL